MPSLLDLLGRLAADPAARASWASSPRSWLDAHDLAGVDPADLAEALALVADTLPAPVAARLGAPAAWTEPPGGLGGSATDPAGPDPASVLGEWVERAAGAFGVDGAGAVDDLDGADLAGVLAADVPGVVADELSALADRLGETGAPGRPEAPDPDDGGDARLGDALAGDDAERGSGPDPAGAPPVVDGAASDAEPYEADRFDAEPFDAEPLDLGRFDGTLGTGDGPAGWAPGHGFANGDDLVGHGDGLLGAGGAPLVPDVDLDAPGEPPPPAVLDDPFDP